MFLSSNLTIPAEYLLTPEVSGPSCFLKFCRLNFFYIYKVSRVVSRGSWIPLKAPDDGDKKCLSSSRLFAIVPFICNDMENFLHGTHMGLKLTAYFD